MSVLELEDVKDHLNIEGRDHDAELQAFIDGAEAAVSRIIGPLVVTQFTERVRGARTMLEVSKLPAVDLLSLAPAGSISSIPLDRLYLDPAGTVEYLAPFGRFSAGVYDITYTAGWANVPGDVDLALKEMVRHLWRSQRGPTVRPGSGGSESVSNTLPGAAYAFPIRVEQLLSPYVPLGSA